MRRFCGGVDPETGGVDVVKLVTIVDVGRAINPVSVEGQIEGGMSMGIGYALMEEIKTNQGVMQNPNLTDYKIPTSMDIEDVTARIVEEPEPSGSFGAKGFSEVTVTPVAAAILNAIYDATGVRIPDIPVVPEKMLNRDSSN